MKLSIDDATKRIDEISQFSEKLGHVLLFLLSEIKEVRSHCTQKNEALKLELSSKTQELEKGLEDESKRLREVLRRENEERQRELRDLEAFTKKENAERKKELEAIQDAMKAENDQRMKESEALKLKMEQENRELQAYLEKDSKEVKAKMEAEAKALKESLNKEASALKSKLSEGEEARRKETKALQQKLEEEKAALAKQMESGSKELSERMAKDEELRRKEAQAMKDKLEAEKKQQGNAITEMFDRLKAENEQRKMEVHGLKDVLVRENNLRARETEDLRMAMELSTQKLSEALEQESADFDQKLKNLEEDISDVITKERKDILGRIENQGTDLKKKIELETNEIRDKIQVDKKFLTARVDEETDERRKDLAAMKANIQKEREELRGQLESDTKMVLDQLEKDSNDILNLLKKERAERERDSNLIKERIDNEKKELQISIDKDRDNLTKRLNEEHNMRRLEQKELVQRLDNNESSGKADIADLYTKLKREQDERETDMEEVRTSIKQEKNLIEEKLIKEKQTLRDSLNNESLEINKRIDKMNVDRMNDVADVQSKMALIGKSASRHLDNLRQSLYRDCQNLFELATKPFSIVFNAFREDSYIEGGEDYLTFTGCTVNIGNAMNPKSGEFKVPEAGLYLFLVTCCTFDMKKCLLSIRKNGKDVANIFDQDGMENRGRTMIGQNVLLELVEGDKVQVYINTGSGLFDHKNSHYTQFIGALLRPSIETLAVSMRKLGSSEDEDELHEDSVRSHMTGLNGGDSSLAPGRRGQRASSRSRFLSPQPPGTGGTSHAPRETTPVTNGTLPSSSEPQVSNGEVQLTHEDNVLPQMPTKPSVNQNQNFSSLTTLDEEVSTTDLSGRDQDLPTPESAPTVNPEPEVQKQETEEEEKPQQSYLALTKLGMGKKSTSAKTNEKNPMGKFGKKSLTDLAASTFVKAGFTKA